MHGAVVRVTAARRAWPVSCLLCRRAAPELLCDDCAASLEPNDRACTACALPMIAAPLPGNLCGACFARAPPQARTVAPFLYRQPLTYLVHRAKFQGGILEAHLLGELLADAIAHAYEESTLPKAIVPVPLSWRRLIVRGHNQATSIARVAARRFGIPILHTACKRVRHTAPQAGLSRPSRLRNLAAAFAVTATPPECVAVVDDVMTTGTTVRAVTRALRAAGTETVHVWAVARTPTFPR